MTPNQIVAHNLRVARAHKRWTQEEAGRRLAPHLGHTMGRASMSVAEKSAEGGKVRHFDADEIAIFARVFDLSIEWFLVPPIDVEVLVGLATVPRDEFVYGEAEIRRA